MYNCLTLNLMNQNLEYKMSQYYTLNIKLSNLQLHTEVNSSNVVSQSHDENNFLHKLLSTNTQVSRLCKAFVNITSVNIKLSKNSIT